MAEVTWTRRALKNWREIVEYLEEHAPRIAAKIGEQLLSAPDILEHSPRAGRRVPEFNQDHVRELVMVRPFRILYILHEGVCHIVAIVHSRRDLRSAVKREDLEGELD